MISRPILGESPSIKSLIQLINKVGPTKTNVLIIGDSGTGKELVARMIHESGPLKNRPFIPVNCGAIPETLIESEMFGHKKGSFTGAVADKPGLFEAANGGTLFLDEVGELPLSMQVKLLRAIQERAFRRVGGTDLTKVDVRIIAATNRDLEEGTRNGTFREDLYYRLNVIQIRTPSLRERPGDISLLANAFLKRYAEKTGKPVQRFSDEAMAALESYRWPGNVRELENVVERAVTLENREEVGVDSLPQMIQDSGARAAGSVESVVSGASDAATSGVGIGVGSAGANETDAGRWIRVPAPDFSRGAVNLDEILGNVERAYLESALQASGGVKKKAAELLGITFRSIRYRLKKLGVEGADGDADSDAGGD